MFFCFFTLNMLWHYFKVFLGSLIVDIVPFPLPPAFTVMIYLQIKFNLNVWAVIACGVLGSIIGRTMLTLYISSVSDRIFKKDKNEDALYIGNRMKQNKNKAR